MQGEATIISQPTAFHNMAATVIQLGQCGLQAFGLQGVVRFLRHDLRGLAVIVGQPVDRRKAVFVVAITHQSHVFASHALFHFQHFRQFHAQIIGDGLRFAIA